MNLLGRFYFIGVCRSQTPNEMTNRFTASVLSAYYQSSKLERTSLRTLVNVTGTKYTLATVKNAIQLWV